MKPEASPKVSGQVPVLPCRSVGRWLALVFISGGLASYWWMAALLHFARHTLKGNSLLSVPAYWILVGGGMATMLSSIGYLAFIGDANSNFSVAVATLVGAMAVLQGTIAFAAVGVGSVQSRMKSRAVGGLSLAMLACLAAVFPPVALWLLQSRMAASIRRTSESASV